MLFFKRAMLGAALISICSSVFAAPEFKKGLWVFDKAEIDAGVAAEKGKLAVRCEAGKLFIELSASDGLGAGKRPDRKIWVKFDQGEFESRIWIHDGSSARLSDFSYVNDFLRKARRARETIWITARNAQDEKIHFAFGAVNSAQAIREVTEACAPA